MQKTALKIEKLVQGGYGLARDEGRAIFVRGAVPGETVEITPGKTHKQYQEATVARVVESSPDRTQPNCPVYGQCGGCHLQHIRYDAQLRMKSEMLVETLARVGKIELPELGPVVPSPQAYGSRSVVRFGLIRTKEGLALGFHEEGSAKLVPVTDCPVLPDPLRKVVAEVVRRLATMAKPPCRIESLELRGSSSFDQMVMILHCEARVKSQATALFGLAEGVPGLVGVIVLGSATVRGARWTRGQDWIAERLDDMVFRISERSFQQSNWAVNRALSKTVIDWTAPEPGLRVLELYAGIGSLGLPLAKRGAFVTLVEGHAVALADARRAANGNHVGRCRFRVAKTETFLPEVPSGEYDVVLADPPRTGFSREALTEVIRIAAPRVFYVSCDPPTLARDLGRLCAADYRVARLQAFDMFPQTAHLETLVELRRAPR